MAASSIVYPVALGSLPDAAITWKDSDKTVIDLTAYSITEARVGKPGKAAAIVKVSGFQTAATAPNLTVAWSADELAELTVGDWVIQIEATRTADSKKRHLVVPMTISDKAVI